MPTFIDDILVVTKEELVPGYYRNENHLLVTLNRYKDKPFGLKRYSRGGGRGKKLLILFDSLPKTIQDSIGDPRQLEHILLRYFTIDDEAVTVYDEYSDEAGGLDPEKKEEYILNASVLNAVIALREARIIEWQGKGRRSMAGLNRTLYADYSTFGEVMLRKFGKTHNLPNNESRFLDKLRKYEAGSREEGYLSFINKNRGNNNAGLRTERARILLESMFAHQNHKPTPAEIHQQYEAFLAGYVEVINNETGEIINPKEYGKLSQRSVSGFLNSWDSAVVTSRKRTGNRQIRLASFVPHEILEHPKFAGSIISVDDRQPPFAYKKATRMWFYNGIDLGSEAITTWVYGTTKEGIILEFYRQMVRNYAEWNLPLPNEIECESNLNASYREGFLKEGSMFKKVRIEANSARSKRCEGYWRPLRYIYEKKHEGWIARPFARSEANQVSTGKEIIVPYDQIVEQSLRDIETWNNTEHSIYKGKTRWEVFLEKQNPDNKNKINWRGILFTLGKMTETSVNMAGQIRFNNSFYMLGDGGTLVTGDKLINYMQLLAGKEIDIYWLDGNDGEVLCSLICLRGQQRIICEAVKQPVTARASIEETPEQKKNRELIARYRSTLEGYSQRRYHDIDKVTIIDHRSEILNNKFQISGLKRYEAEPVADVDILDEMGEFEDDSNPVQLTYEDSLYNRF